MKSMSPTKKICTASICVALCYVLPLILHSVGAGQAFSPMHFPVLICGIICGPLFGALCGIIGPIISSILSGMPQAPQLITMIPELVAYGIISGIIFKFVRTGSTYANLYISLIPAMLIGRIIGGITKVFVYLSNAEAYSISLWVSSYIVKTLPGIVAQLIIIPILIFALIKSNIIPASEALKVNE